MTDTRLHLKADRFNLVPQVLVIAFNLISVSQHNITIHLVEGFAFSQAASNHCRIASAGIVAFFSDPPSR